MSLPAKNVTCKCGYTAALEKSHVWCDKCGRKIFYDPKDQRRHQWNTYYIYTIMILVFGFIGYLFFELVARPFLGAG